MTAILWILFSMTTVMVVAKTYSLYLNPPEFRPSGQSYDEVDASLLEVTAKLESGIWALSLFATATLMYTLLSTIGMMLLSLQLKGEGLGDAGVHLLLGVGIWFYAGMAYAIFMNRVNILQNNFGKRALNYVVENSITALKNKKIGING